MLTNNVHLLKNYTTAKQMIAGKEEKDELVKRKINPETLTIKITVVQS